MRLPEEVRAAVSLLKQAGFQPQVTPGTHIKIKAPGIPLIVCASTSSDHRSTANTIARTKRYIRNAGTPA